MRLVRSNIGFKGLLGAQVQEVVLGDELLQLRLDVGHLAPGELELVQGNVCLAEVAEESQFFGSQNQEGVAFASLASGSPSLKKSKQSQPCPLRSF